MPGLFGALQASASTLRFFDAALATAQNNVNNASTPGFARQRITGLSAPFIPEGGQLGGLEGWELKSLRSEYAEQAVRQAASQFGRYDQKASDLSRVEGIFDASGQTGVPGALSKLFQSISAWSVVPNDTGPRQQVIDRASDVAASFRETATDLTRAEAQVDQQIRSVVDTVNSLASSIRDLNVQMQRDFRARSDPSLDAQLHDTLERLSEYVDFNALRQPDGSVTVLMGGQVPLVNGERFYEISTEFTASETRILDASGKDVGTLVSEGRLGALLEMRNTTLPGYLADLNRLASGLADDINAMLAGGWDLNGDPGAPLFSYVSADNAASTLQVTSITPEQLAGATPAKPGGNENTLNLAALANGAQLDGLSYTAFYGQLAARVGQAIAASKNDQQTHQQMLLQTRSMREEISGVSLDEEATRLIEFQRAYQATAHLISVLNDLTQVTIDMVK
jgi:flagellar hook-associated protein 1 FlgK